MQVRPTWLRSLPPLVLADLRRRYAGSTLGAIWALVGPLLEATTYAVVFGWVLGIPTQAGMPYAVLIASGLFPWISLREAVEGSATVLADNRWIRRSRVPAELLIARLVLTSAARGLIGLVVVLGYGIACGRRPGLLVWTLPLLGMVIQVILTFGLGRLVAPVATLVPDLRPTLVSLLTLLTFASPVLYPESVARGWLRTLLVCNPFTHLLRLYRAPLEPLAWQAMLVSLAVVSATALAAVVCGSVVRARVWWTARDAL
jgi:ABC-type polysaccharide/polyol phosphate export permease